MYICARAHIHTYTHTHTQRNKLLVLIGSYTSSYIFLSSDLP